AILRSSVNLYWLHGLNMKQCFLASGRRGRNHRKRDIDEHCSNASNGADVPKATNATLSIVEGGNDLNSLE
ncbi:hypothetical protein Tco_1100016, partial [Tanacetum coccineum]